MTVRLYLTGRITVEVDEELVVDERRFRGKQGRLAFGQKAFCQPLAGVVALLYHLPGQNVVLLGGLGVQR